MDRPDWKSALGEAFAQALSYLDGLPDRPVHPAADLAQLRAALGGPLPERPLDARDVVADLAAAAGPGVIASGSGRFFGFVVGGATPAALAADWLASAWDQNAGLYVLGPAAAVVEEVAGAWAADLLGLPPQVSVGFVTGAQMANFTGLAAALHAVLGRAGWDVELGGAVGCPAGPRARGRAAARHRRPGAALPRRRHRGDRADPRGRPGADAGGRARQCIRRGPRRPPGDRVRAGRQRQHRRRRPGRADQRHRPPARRVGARRRRVRAVGGGEPAAAAAAGRRRASGLVGDRRAQVAQRALRLRPGLLCRPAGTPGRDGRAGGLSRARVGRRARRARPQPRDLPARPRVRRVRRAAGAGARRRRRSGRAQLRAGPPVRRRSWARPRASRS